MKAEGTPSAWPRQRLDYLLTIYYSNIMTIPLVTYNSANSLEHSLKTDSLYIQYSNTAVISINKTVIAIMVCAITKRLKLVHKK